MSKSFPSDKVNTSFSGVDGLGESDNGVIRGSLDFLLGGERPERFSNISSRRIVRFFFLIQLVISLFRRW